MAFFLVNKSSRHTLVATQVCNTIRQNKIRQNVVEVKIDNLIQSFLMFVCVSLGYGGLSEDTSPLQIHLSISNFVQS